MSRALSGPEQQKLAGEIAALQSFVVATLKK
jgi:hypothetical protein